MIKHPPDINDGKEWFEMDMAHHEAGHAVTSRSRRSGLCGPSGRIMLGWRVTRQDREVGMKRIAALAAATAVISTLTAITGDRSAVRHA
jgi:hypothetical protein